MARIAVLTGDVLGDRMAGPAIRATSIAEHLSAAHDVTLHSTVGGGARELRSAVVDADVLVVQGYVTHDAPWLLRTDKVVVVDLYDPLHLEQLEQSHDLDAPRRQESVDLTVRVLNEQLLRADLLLCASTEQRQLWLGHLAALGRVNVATHAQDPSLRSLLAICPFGMPADEPVRHGSPLRTGLGLGPDARIVLWAGGLYDWLDPVTAIRAVDLLRRERPDVALVFQGVRHPNQAVARMSAPEQCRRLADDLGLTGRHVFFVDEWVPYDRRQDHLLDADVGLSTHVDHLESQFAYRTRVLDYLWAGRPVVATEGDALSALVDREGLGTVVPPGDPAALAAALEGLLYDAAAWDRAAGNIARVRPTLTWERALAPLVEFCRAPRRAADADLDRARLVRRPVLPAAPLPRLGARAALVLRRGGVRELGARVAARLRRRRA